MKMALVLIEIRSQFPGFSGSYSEGIASIAASIKAAGHDFELIHLTQPTPVRALISRVASAQPNLIGFSCMTNTVQYLERFAAAVRQAFPLVPVVAGGVHPSIQPETCLAMNGVDYVCVGEGEQTAVDILNRLAISAPLTGVPGLWFKNGENIICPPPQPAMLLDDLPIPDRSVFDFERLVTTREGVLYVHASRGCPYDCRFCCNAALRARWPKHVKYLRYKSIGRLCDEIEDALRFFPASPRGIYFQDEILGLNRHWLKEFANIYPRRIALPFSCNLRADGVDMETVALLKRAGCRRVSVGLETGRECLRNDLLGKTISNKQFDEAFELLHQADISITSYSMIGLPFENLDDAVSTIEMNADPRIDRRLVSIFYPYPETALHGAVRDAGLMSSRHPDTYQETSPLDQTSLGRHQVEFIHEFFTILVSLAGAQRRVPAFILELLAHHQRTMVALVRLKRCIWRIAVPLYLLLGRHLANRQARVFKA